MLIQACRAVPRTLASTTLANVHLVLLPPPIAQQKQKLTAVEIGALWELALLALLRLLLLVLPT